MSIKKQTTYFNIIFEDILSEAVIRQIMAQSGRSYQIANAYNGRGNGYIKKNICGFNKAAQGMPYFVLTDCDKYRCAIALIKDYLPDKIHPNMLFRIAVPEIESWLLADREGFAEYLGISINLIPINVDSLLDPKQSLINLARKSRKKDLRTGIVPKSNSTAIQGPNYNHCLIPFVKESWSLENACNNSESLLRALNSLLNFK
ncbi:MAG: hypothetical protein WC109_01020 [Syntrophomonadaceae bacterium]|nr:hypothetical protein [Syntrophomonadaceae bacterium]MDD3897382.1 hypothetical protein [Syntrophomonadaceae bacterium]MDD4561657.1 hypothetical protein [Syntrophomonadaceae bacterium]